ncbi:hypothetical protein CHS0354_016095 [Potamilus streckersoni]|uniref:Attractin/MKLN-like beta-propeller domain-containing protein n=1 Tax=Potamilus streckersoni TaxID=2493646 RepID=A0AAE0T214_9BIVA|nr:hypothetical protein CHS0354_016095 [Potamilus streckersoni]
MTEESAVPLQFKCFSPNLSDNSPLHLEPRSGHRIVVDESDLYCLGGYNPDFWDIPNEEGSGTTYPLFAELWRFNFATRKWTLLKTKGQMPVELASHTLLKCGRHLIHLAGTGVPFGINKSNMVTSIDLRDLCWKQLNCSGELPLPIYGHTVTKVGDYVYVMGGTTEYVYHMEVHRLNLKSLYWEHLTKEDKEWKCVKNIPVPRYRHEVVYLDGKLYVFGGGTGVDAYSLKKIPAFDVDTHIWEKIVTVPDIIHGFPKPRKCHSCVQMENEVYVCGGLTKELCILPCLWKFCLYTHKWTKLSVELQVPVYFHSADLTQAGCMYIFGGVTHYEDKRTNIIQKIWLKIPSLMEMCWEKLCNLIEMEKYAKDKTVLISLGIPRHLMDRIS